MNPALNIKIDNLPPMPRNRSHMLTGKGGKCMLIKTPLAREFEKDLVSRLLDYSPHIARFKEHFSPDQHFLKVTYTIYTPHNDLFTKDGRISLKAVDCDAHKLFQDVLFREIGIDDKFIRNVQYFTPESRDEYWNYSVNIEVYELEVLYV